jgi:hypothetical protein
MNWTQECLEKSESFVKICESNHLLMEKLSMGNLKPLSLEEEKILTEWLESGNPEVWTFLENFVKSDFFQEIVKNH